MYVYYKWNWGYSLFISDREDLISLRNYENESVWMVPGTVSPLED